MQHFFCALWLLLLAGCGAAGDHIVVTPLDKQEFQTFVRDFRPELTRQGVLAPDGAFYSPMLSLPDFGENYGEILYSRLSPSFRFPGMDAGLYPSSFEGLALPDAKVTKDKYGFTLGQGLETVLCRIIASADWDRDGRDDWIVLCRVVQREIPSAPAPYTSAGRKKPGAQEKAAAADPAAAPRAVREYYLVLTDVKAAALRAQIIGVRDMAGTRKALFHRPEDAARYGLLRESAAIDILHGQQEITQPPQKIPDKTAPDGLRETKLAQ